MCVSAVGREKKWSTLERMVVCKHNNILSQGENETTKKMKAMTEKGDVRGTEEGQKVGLTCHKNRQHIKIHG